MERVHYIWITWYSSTGSKSSYLFYNGNCSLDEAKECINGSKGRDLFKCYPSFLKDCIKVRMSAQNIKTGKVLYEKVVISKTRIIGSKRNKFSNASV